MRGRNMSRIINTANPGKLRNQLRRTIAELLRHMMFKQEIDEESKDMAATLVFCLRGVTETIETTTTAWEKRNYFLKADRFLLEWEWAKPASERLQDLVVNDQWELLPQELAKLAPYFADIRIAKMTRPASIWESRSRLLKEEVNRGKRQNP